MEVSTPLAPSQLAPSQLAPSQLARFLPSGTFSAACPSRVVLDHVTSKWGVLVLVALADGPLRWSELRRRAQGVSEKMLSQTLRVLERDGLVHRDAQPVIPPRVDYQLTDRGTELVAHLVPLMTWIAQNADDIVGPPPDR
jgi:DNA-binding HxlR family transcriptional regulator